MKPILVISAFLLCTLHSSGQITSPIIRAGFGVDADLMRSYFNNAVQTGNDDWFNSNTIENATDDFVIDTTGAAAIYAGYTSNPASRFNSFVRGMRYPLLSTIKNRIYYDAVFIRDYHGNDSTSFTGGSKNGQTPADWSTSVSPVLAKNDIVDGFLHVRRDGTTSNDSLWFFGAVGILGTNGDRYFDFELYQTDISFNRTTRKFENYGPDAGHTSWKFAGDGSTKQVGDIIFTAEYSNSGLSLIEARIWVAKTAISTVTPRAFSWTGSFDGDGAGATYGYAGIVPKTGGAFYQGLQNSGNAYTGPFGTIKSGDVPSTQYDPIQYMELSVNLTKLGLDPMSFTTGSLCNLAFGKVLIKTRVSTSFTSSISDFASPFSFRALPKVDIASDIPLFCAEQNIANIWVLNPLPTSTYTFTTTNGHIFSSGPTSMVADSAGTYIVIQTLLDGCAEGGRDTIVIGRLPGNTCVPLSSRLLRFDTELKGGLVINQSLFSTAIDIRTVELQRSADRVHYTPLAALFPADYAAGTVAFRITDDRPATDPVLYYRLLVTEQSGYRYYSQVNVVRTVVPAAQQLSIYPNPVAAGSSFTIRINSERSEPAEVRILDINGTVISTTMLRLQSGANSIQMNTGHQAVSGKMMLIMLTTADKMLSAKMILR